MVGTLKIWLGDQVVDEGEAQVSVFDAGFQSGDAVWEGMRVYNGKVFKLDQHLERLEESARALNIQLPGNREHIAGAIYQSLDANGFTTDTHIRLMVTRGRRRTSGMNPATAPERGFLVIIPENKPVEIDPTPLTLRTASVRRPQPHVLPATLHHSNQLNSIVARLEVKNVPGVDAALMLDEFGYVAEVDNANIFFANGKMVATPFGTACLRGITRQTVLELAEDAGYRAVEQQFALHDLYTADEVFVTGTQCELTPVTEIDGRPIGAGKPGPVWRDLLTRYRDLVQASVK